MDVRDVAFRRVVALHDSSVSAGVGRRLDSVASMRPWPSVAEEDQWLIELMEERFEQTSKSPEQLQARAKELVAQAEAAHAGGHRDALLALADRYEAAAEARLSRR